MSRALSQILLKNPNLVARDTIDNLHVDTINFRNRILAKGGGINTSILIAVDKFVRSIYSNSLRSSILECYPFVGNNLAQGATTKLWFVNNPDLINVNLTESNYSNPTGVTGNGTNGALNTNFIPALHGLTTTSASLGVYSRTNGTSNQILAGCTSGSDAQFNLIPAFGDGNNYFDAFNLVTGRIMNLAGAENRRLHIGTRVSATDTRYFQNGTQLGSGMMSGGSLPTVALLLLAYNNNGAGTSYSNRSIGFAFIGRGLSVPQVGTLTTLVNTLMSNLGRAV